MQRCYRISRAFELNLLSAAVDPELCVSVLLMHDVAGVQMLVTLDTTRMEIGETPDTVFAAIERGMTVRDIAWQRLNLQTGKPLDAA